MVLHMFDLPDAPLDAAAHFFSEHLPLARDLLKEGANKRLPGPGLPEEIDAIAFVFPSAGKEHHGWRLAVIQELAREAAPKRVNCIAGDDLDAIDEAIKWLASAPGITGQLFAVDGKSAEMR